MFSKPKSDDVNEIFHLQLHLTAKLPVFSYNDGVRVLIGSSEASVVLCVSAAMHLIHPPVSLLGGRALQVQPAGQAGPDGLLPHRRGGGPGHLRRGGEEPPAPTFQKRKSWSCDHHFTAFFTSSGQPQQHRRQRRTHPEGRQDPAGTRSASPILLSRNIL